MVSQAKEHGYNQTPHFMDFFFRCAANFETKRQRNTRRRKRGASGIWERTKKKQQTLKKSLRIKNLLSKEERRTRDAEG
jgi:hypothetical protein